jgi:RNA polymerase sigma-70 factor (ECF subfamily)
LLLLRRIRSGDEEALELLCRRYLPRLRRWAAGRLPSSARDLLDTQDLVQETMIRAINRLPEFEPRHDGALQAYLREAILNRIRDEIRRTRSHPDATGVDSQVVVPGPSPRQEAVGQAVAERYVRALGRLKADDQEAILLRIELGYGYQQIAEALGKPSADAARMAVSRALVRLAEEMRHETR